MSDGLDNFFKVLVTLVIVLFLGLVYISILEFTQPKTITLYVTSVKYYPPLDRTEINSYETCVIFNGKHPEITTGKTYTFVYISRIPYAKLLSLETHDRRTEVET